MQRMMNTQQQHWARLAIHRAQLYREADSAFVGGMLFVNRTTWIHAVAAAAQAAGGAVDRLREPAEAKAVRGEGDPAVVMNKY